MARRIHYLPMLALLLFALHGRPAWSQDTSEPTKREPIRTVQLLVDPKPEPQCALAYRLETPYMEQRPGNGALLYSTALSLVSQIKGQHPEVDEKKLDEWCDSPVDKLPRQQLQEAIVAFEQPLHCLDLAGRCEYCTWEYPVRDEGLRAAMPPEGGYRMLLRMLVLKARLETADGDVNSAIGTLRTGLAAAKGISSGPFVVQNLIGVSLARRTIREIEGLIQTPKAPNLYWALTALPHPLLDVRRSLQMEMDAPYAGLPELRRLEHEVLSDDQVVQVWTKAAAMFAVDHAPKDEVSDKARLVAGAMKLYPAAKQYLLDKGKTAEEIELLPRLYTVLLYQHVRSRQICDAILKWSEVPYWQAAGRLEQSKDLMSKAMSTGDADMDVIAGAFAMSMPWIQGVYLHNTCLERDIAMLRCVEAIRMYAAGHGGALPQTLDDVTQVPIPQDPLYGHAFNYQVAAGKAVLESPAPPDGTSARLGQRYEITIRQATK